MAKTLYELAMEYLNQGMPDITQTPRVTPPGTLPPSQPGFPTPDPRMGTILPAQGGGDGFGEGLLATCLGLDWFCLFRRAFSLRSFSSSS